MWRCDLKTHTKNILAIFSRGSNRPNFGGLDFLGKPVIFTKGLLGIPIEITKLTNVYDRVFRGPQIPVYGKSAYIAPKSATLE